MEHFGAFKTDPVSLDMHAGHDEPLYGMLAGEVSPGLSNTSPENVSFSKSNVLNQQSPDKGLEIHSGQVTDLHQLQQRQQKNVDQSAFNSVHTLSDESNASCGYEDALSLARIHPEKVGHNKPYATYIPTYQGYGSSPALATQIYHDNEASVLATNSNHHPRMSQTGYIMGKPGLPGQGYKSMEGFAPMPMSIYAQALDEDSEGHHRHHPDDSDDLDILLHSTPVHGYPDRPPKQMPMPHMPPAYRNHPQVQGGYPTLQRDCSGDYATMTYSPPQSATPVQQRAPLPQHHMPTPQVQARRMAPPRIAVDTMYPVAVGPPRSHSPVATPSPVDSPLSRSQSMPLPTDVGSVDIAQLELALSMPVDGRDLDVLEDLDPDMMPMLLQKAKKKGKGGRTPALDPRLDPNIDPKKAKRILANRQSAARSKLKQKVMMEGLRAKHKLLLGHKDTFSREVDGLKKMIQDLEHKNQALVRKITEAEAEAPEPMRGYPVQGRQLPPSLPLVGLPHVGPPPGLMPCNNKGFHKGALPQQLAAKHHAVNTYNGMGGMHPHAQLQPHGMPMHPHHGGHAHDGMAGGVPYWYPQAGPEDHPGPQCKRIKLEQQGF